MNQPNDMKLLTVGEWIKNCDLEGSHDVLTIKSVTLKRVTEHLRARCVFPVSNQAVKGYILIESLQNLNMLKKKKKHNVLSHIIAVIKTNDTAESASRTQIQMPARGPVVVRILFLLQSWLLFWGSVLLCVPRQPVARSVGTHQWLSVCRGWRCQPGANREC